MTLHDVRYSFDVTRRDAPRLRRSRIGGQRIVGAVREQPDGSLLATIAGKTRKLFGQEPLACASSLDIATSSSPTSPTRRSCAPT